MKVLRKIIAVILFLAATYVSFGLGGIILMEGYNPFVPYADTKFAKNFSIKKSKNIKVGMTKAEVYKIIGAPYYISNEIDNSGAEIVLYRYTSDGKLKSFDLAWYGYTLYLDKSDVVSEINARWVYD